MPLFTRRKFTVFQQPRPFAWLLILAGLLAGCQTAEPALRTSHIEPQLNPPSANAVFFPLTVAQASSRTSATKAFFPILLHNVAPNATPGSFQVVENSPPPPPSSDFYGIDFNDQDKWIRIKIYPADKSVNRGKPIVIPFIPGNHCNFGDKHGCIATFRTGEMGSVIFVTVHSGVWGQGQAFRNAVEGTGFDRAGLSLPKVQANLKALEGARVAITQGKTEFGGFTLTAVTRVPAVSLQRYFSAPVEKALDVASALDASFSSHFDWGQPLIVFETCGWKMPGEPWAAGVSSTTGSVYLGVVQK